MAAQVYRDDELVTLQNSLTGLTPPLQSHLGRPFPHILVQVLLVVPMMFRTSSQQCQKSFAYTLLQYQCLAQGIDAGIGHLPVASEYHAAFCLQIPSTYDSKCCQCPHKDSLFTRSKQAAAGLFAEAAPQKYQDSFTTIRPDKADDVWQITSDHYKQGLTYRACSRRRC